MPPRDSRARRVLSPKNVDLDDPESPQLWEVKQSLGYKIRYAYRAFVKALADELGPHAVTTTQWSALRVLWTGDGFSQVELARRMMVEKASLTALLHAMETAGLIRRTRDPEDRRKVNIHLTAAGRRLRDKVLPLAGKINRRATRSLTVTEVQQFELLLTKIVENLQR
jgi:MarR family transcriptional regulator, organic hydroperoxide resistance regulator